MNKPTYIIAEAGVNHNGSLEMALRLIDVAVDAGADAVKFQTFKAEKIVTQSAPKAEYQQQTTDANESQFAMIKKLELSEADHLQLLQYCQKVGIAFLSTPFDEDSIDFLVNQLGLSSLKMASGEITNAPLLLKAARTQCPVILSTGMSTLGDVETALSVLAFGYTQPMGIEPNLTRFMQAYHSPTGQAVLQEKVILLHCTTEYPAPVDQVNLYAMDTLQAAFGLPVGLSDHTEGIVIPLAAVARGACVIEKHFTLDRQLPGPDHRASLEPAELKAMVQGIRQIEQAFGHSIKKPSVSEQANREIARKSLTATRNIKQGEAFTTENLTIKRPGTGISPLFYWNWLHKTAERDYVADELI
ncbi:N-acetylneuraminate synthase [Beggiatoa leptomitoformis]|uniref:N-acetylneuraminate synthase n=1 Tax=Beggiatoa leptomitoformis TaxID=288004 RepID=A0A2N9YI41_9GAMM|nr:N-acetylneuraminate synthase [Beggiatoa leptomitoformis]ALG67633.1 N-acetylneuraminate synthase [Beggiatoa leptomitoformis]AUI70133.1 N-acetylneuraminate synthase [Beggiatoa leptomitoformis]